MCELTYCVLFPGPHHCPPPAGRTVRYGREIPGTLSRAGTGSHCTQDDREWSSGGKLASSLTIEYKHILAALIDSEQMLLSIEAQLCTRIECKTFRPRRPSSVAMHSIRVHSCASMLNNICSESMSAARMCLYSIVKLEGYLKVRQRTTAHFLWCFFLTPPLSPSSNDIVSLIL